ncbi:MAG: SDR family NAD(P)-dependent oxidoreductase [Rhodobacteraceae bacterium]|nr:SDR family NAD(P)-dependent oxidoreductase [Paracoccaceae bacterium]
MSRTAIITGGAGGLGRSLDTGLRARGWTTVLVDLPGPALAALPTLPDRLVLAGDLTDAAAINSICDQVRAARPSIDLVIYNAGITQIGAFGDAPLEAHRAVFAINYFAAVEMAKELLADIRAAQGTHLAISSVAGFSPLFHRTAYAASKHALEGFFASLRAEEKDFGVDCLIAAPSFVATNPGNPDLRPGGIARPGSATDGIDYMPPEQAAGIILKGLERRQAFIPVGRVARMAYLLNRLSPALFARMMERSIKRGDR